MQVVTPCYGYGVTNHNGHELLPQRYPKVDLRVFRWGKGEHDSNGENIDRRMGEEGEARPGAA